MQSLTTDVISVTAEEFYNNVLRAFGGDFCRRLFVVFGGKMITHIDFSILNFIQQCRSAALDDIFTFITHLGDSGAIWILISVVMLFLSGYRKTGVRTLITMAVASIIFTLIMKELVGRERPFNNPMGLLGADDLIIPVPFGRYSFPSGHTLTSFAASSCIFLTNKKIGAVCIVAAILISFSRIYLYVHFPSDIIFGAIFGILSALAVKYFEDKLSARLRAGNTK